MPKVSICIPAYKNAAGIVRLLDTVKQQGYTDYEVIITDDSPDDSVKTAAQESGIAELLYHKNEKRLGYESFLFQLTTNTELCFQCTSFFDIVC